MANQPQTLEVEKVAEDALMPAAKKKRLQRVIIIGSAVLVLGFAGAVFFLAPGLIPNPWRSKTQPQKEGKAALKETHGHLYSMDPFVVNLADTDSQRYLKIKIDLESNEAKPSEEYGKRLPQLRDTMITLLSGKTFQEINDLGGKNKLKEEMMAKINPFVSGFKIKAVYFTEFVVQ